MAEEFETVELEYSEEDIVYYIFDEDGNEIGFALDENGTETEYYYDGTDASEYETVEAEGVADGADGAGSAIEAADNSENQANIADLAELDGEIVEMEIDEDAIDHYIFDKRGNEIGFAIVEDGVVVECYYQDDEGADGVEPAASDKAAPTSEAVSTPAPEPAPKPASGSKPASKSASEPEEPVEHGYLYKLAQIAGHEGNKARKKAGAEISKQRDKAKPTLDKARSRAEAGIDKAAEAVESGGKKLKEKKDEYDLGITREDVSEATADLNAIAKEGAATAKELKETYDDIMDSFGAFLPKSVRRKLP